MKVIFLDIDGVLNTSETFIRRKNKYFKTGIYDLEIDLFRVEYLKQIIDETDAKIVLSSSWRSYFLKFDKEIIPATLKAVELCNIFNKYNIEIYDITSKDNNLTRGTQINMWLNDNAVDSFVILDDESSHLQEFIGKELIKTSKVKDGEILTNMDDCLGLSPEDVEKAISILNCKNKVKKISV